MNTLKMLDAWLSQSFMHHQPKMRPMIMGSGSLVINLLHTCSGSVTHK